MPKSTRSYIDWNSLSGTRKLVFLSILIANSLALYIIEGMIPVPFIVPGAKLGLANIITVISLYLFGFYNTLVVIGVRILLSAFFAASPSSFFYSIGGGLLSLVAMFAVKNLGGDNVSEIGVSVIGAVFHNIGQMAVAALILQNVNIMIYVPVLMIVGIGTGIFVGLSARFVMNHWRKLKGINLY
ncbi:heptaprenyl diphosphate synthase [Caldanaerobius fijiensis DSM 17918]|uniref:Heptaprenyl diphosphate synthase n=1 Tax=Caldanaerobius fijiensis DSM 17918 TaxID=1121256 RepID=A0A1M5CNZ3_9THEO|nr:Gx transporter family protein [Caldanaerobius fijiensis]SHF56429.1 heptaprenyl diphosphate synthase [Caldanaerobius fijiensis DSM 17918]